jgi:hypothetical protein
VAELLQFRAALGQLVLDVDVAGGQQAADAVDDLGSKQRLPGTGGVLAGVEVVVDDLPQLVVVETGEDLRGEDLRRIVEEDGHGASLWAVGAPAKPPTAAGLAGGHTALEQPTTLARHPQTAGSSLTDAQWSAVADAVALAARPGASRSAPKHLAGGGVAPTGLEASLPLGDLGLRLQPGKPQRPYIVANDLTATRVGTTPQRLAPCGSRTDTPTRVGTTLSHLL